MRRVKAGDGEAIDNVAPAAQIGVRNPMRIAAVQRLGITTGAIQPRLDRIAWLIRTMCGSEFGAANIADGEHLYWRRHVDERNPVFDQIDPLDSAPLTAQIIDTGLPVIVNDTREHPDRPTPSGWAGDVRSFIGVPLWDRGGHLIGVVCACDRYARTWSETDRVLLEGLSRIATDEIDAAMQQRAAARAETLLANVLGGADAHFALIDSDMRVVMINDSMAGSHSVQREAAVGQRFDELFVDFDPPLSDLVSNVLDTGTAVDNHQIVGPRRSRYGPERVFNTNCFRLSTGGSDHAVVIAAEITDQVKMRERAERLATVAESLTCAVIPHHLDDTARQLQEFFSADNAELSIWPGASSNDATTPTGIPLSAFDPDSALARAIRSREVAVVGHAPYTGAPAGEAALTEAVVPCMSAGQRLGGLLTLRWQRGIPADELSMAELRSVGSLLGGVLEREHLSSERAELLNQLRDALLVPPMRRPGLEPAARYRAALDSADFGGDWYDTVPLDDTRTALVIGDVVGHGPAAAAAMSQISGAVAQLLVRQVDLDEVFAEAERVLRARSIDTMATVAIAVIDVERQTITMVSAGHPPPLIVRSDGRAELLRPPVRPPLGSFPTASETLTVPYEHGSRLVLYTDGLVEQRTDDIESSLKRLTCLAQLNAREPIERFLDRLIEELHPGYDDLAVLAANLDGPT